MWVLGGLREGLIPLSAVAGAPVLKTGTIKYGLVKMAGHGPNGTGEKMICVHPDDVTNTNDAKRATTDYSMIENAGASPPPPFWFQTFRD